MGRLGAFIFLALLVIFLCVSLVGLIVRIARYIGESISETWNKLTAPSQIKPEAKAPAGSQERESCQYGSCEICGRQFTDASSSPDDCLRRITYDFYGRQRTKLICNKCLAVLREEQHLAQGKKQSRE